MMRFNCLLLCLSGLTAVWSCSMLSKTYDVVGGTVKTSYRVTKGVSKAALGTGKIVYKVGGYTFKVVMAPLSWPFIHDEIESVDGLPPKEAVRMGRVKKAPYVVRGKRYVPMSLEEARRFSEKGRNYFLDINAYCMHYVRSMRSYTRAMAI